MRKHFSKAMALLLVLAMILTMLPLTAFAADVSSDDSAVFLSGMPEDQTYGVIYNYDSGNSKGYVMGYDITDGNAASLEVQLSDDGSSIAGLPDGTAIFKFLKNADDTYYLTLGGKYLVLKDLDSDNVEKLVLCDTAETGAKWKITADKGGASGMFNLLSAEYKWNGSQDVYLEQYKGQKWCGFSYRSDTPEYFQFRFARTDADDDGRVGVMASSGALPEAGATVVIYNDYAKAVFGQPAIGAAKDNLTAAAAVRTGEEGSYALAYDDIGDGGLIFTVSVETAGSNTWYMFRTGDKYLGMSVNKKDENGKLVSEESMILIPEADLDSTDEQDVALREYTKWSMSEINGGWLMKNKTAVWKGNAVYVEFFDGLFCGYSFDSSRPEIFAMNFFPMTDRYGCGYVVNPAVSIETPAPAIGADCQVNFAIDDLNEITGINVEYCTTGKDGSQDAPHTVTPELNGKLGTFIIPAADLEAKATLTVRVAVTDSMELSFSEEITVDVADEPLILALAPKPNSATGSVTRPEISATFANVGENPTMEMLLDDEAVPAAVTGNKFAYTPAEDLLQGKHTVSVTMTRADGKTVTKNWRFFIGDSGETLYFGQIHSHTAEYSDGAGQLEQAYEHAYEAQDLDFLIVTDHSNYFDTTKTATTSSYYDLNSLTKTADNSTTKWEEARATAKTYNDRWEDFICLYGYEMTWSGGPGHTNTFNTYGVVSRNNTSLNNKTNHAGMFLYNDLMVNAERGLDVDGKEAKITRNGEEVTGVNATKDIPFDADGQPVPVVSQFNHPGTTFGNFGNFAGYTARRDDVLNLVEVGNGEGKVGGSGYFPSYEQYDLALSMGWHIAPTNNQDNHKGNWGDSNTCRNVILTEDFSPEGIYRALDERRVYATEDQNLEIYYDLKVGDELFKMGEIAPFADDNQPETVKIVLTVSDPDAKDKISKIQVIGEGGVALCELNPNTNNYRGETSLPNTSGYYYVKVVQADGNIAVTAPVWMKEAVPVSADLKTSAAVAAQGVEETVSATLTNGSENQTITLTSWRIIADGETVAQSEAGLSETVAAGAEKKIEVPYTPAGTEPSAARTYEIQAEFTYLYKGLEKSVVRTITETSYPPELMTYVGIDNGHKNFYVSGDYSGCDSSFIQICADHGILCEYIEEGKMTAENLAKYKMIVLTVPRINETTQPPVWSEEELAAIADYAANGGNILNLSKSDRYDYAETGEDGNDTYRYASATMSNLVNEAIGAKARFIRGIVVDTEKGTGNFRIWFDGIDCVNDDHPFTQAIVAASNGQYQWYNGTGITPNGATTLIKPYDSSWVALYKDPVTGENAPDYNRSTHQADKGDFSLITYEDLPGGGFLVCGGAAFVTTYDLKTDDPAAQQYENYSMVLNILEYVKNNNTVVTPEITPIRDVHAYGEEHGEAAATGTEFTIEGWITSNASDYDKDTAFFDCVYIQDETRGINAFPVSGYYYIGEHVRAHGAISYYCGEIELNLKPEYNGYIKVVGNDVNRIKPREVTCAKAVSDENIGNLMKIKGVITDIHKTEGVIDYIYVDDGTGELGTLFINNYIQKDYHGLDGAQVGMMCEGVGIGSRDVNENSTGEDGDQYIRRLRVRSRQEIKCYTETEYTAPDTTALEAAVAGAQTIDTSAYTAETAAALTEALAAAQAVLARDDKTQIEVNRALTALRAAVDGLARPDAVEYLTGTDAVYLEAAVAGAKTVKTAPYTKKSVDAFRSALSTAEKVLAKQEQNFTKIVKTADALYAAIDGLKKTDPCAKYTDVNRKSWYHKGVDYAISVGLMNGMSDTTFCPNEVLTRAQLVTILYRMDGEPRVSASNPFTDVPDGKWFTKAILWANEKGVTNGVGNGRFDPNGKVTREQMATFLYRYMVFKGYDVSAQADLSGFSDVGRLSKWAKNAMKWAVGVGVIKGVDEGGASCLKPGDYATRAMFATIMMRLNAMYSIKEAVDTTALKATVAGAKSIKTAAYSAGSVFWMKEALKTAKADLAAQNVTQAGLKDAAENLRAAILGLEVEVKPEMGVDSAKLQAEITGAQSVDIALFTENSAAALTEALTAAQAVLAKEDKTQDEVDGAVKALREAIDELKKVTVVDTAALEAVIAEAEAVNTSLYTADSVAALTAALTDAKAVLADEGKTQAEVNEAAALLRAAIDALAEKPPVGNSDTYVLADSLSDGDRVVIYNPGHERAVKNGNYRNWYMLAAEVTVEDGRITEPAADVIWTVHVDEEGSYSFSNGENKIVMWLSVDRAEVTNDASYTGADPLWKLISANAENKSFYIQSKTIKHASKGDGYLECYEKTFNNVTEPYTAGYFTNSPKEEHLAFQFYVCAGEQDPG